MSNLLGLSYYDEEEEEDLQQQNDNQETSTESFFVEQNNSTIIAVIHPKDTKDVDFKNSDSMPNATIDNMNVSKETTAIETIKVETSPVSKPQTPSPNSFSTLVRRRYNEPNAAAKELRKQMRMRELLRPKPIPDVENWGIPPEPDAECDPNVQEKISRVMYLWGKGQNCTFSPIKRTREFVELDEIGSNFPKDVFDPYGFPREMYADKLAETQRRITEERQAAQLQQQRTHIQFVGSSGSSAGISKSRHVMQSLAARASSSTITASSMTSSTTVSSNSAPSGKKRTSKWDVPAAASAPAASSSTSSRSIHETVREQGINHNNTNYTFG
ncbi:10053_t:CDS:10 [Ambispora gerdemannii]|uniref:10053_t:CDS:1 n=1 Tax=Ambispora gerdemannii TaxID=144530 RepID=A0A9N9F843_9GLOM|nr:10053_t:CDS:10 [Ambispora gerdemannii]